MVVEISSVLHRRIVCEVERIGGLVLSVDFTSICRRLFELYLSRWRMAVVQEVGWERRNGEGRARKDEF